MAFKIGDKVRLASGGPVMVVFREVDDPHEWQVAGWECQWFVYGALRYGIFKIETLEPVPDAPATQKRRRKADAA